MSHEPVMPIWVRAMLSLRGEAYRVWSYLAWRQGQHGAAWPSLPKLAADLGLTVQGVRGITRRLADVGWLTIEAPNTSGRKHGLRYVVTCPEGSTVIDRSEGQKVNDGVPLCGAKGSTTVDGSGAEGSTAIARKGQRRLTRTLTGTLTSKILPIAYRDYWARYPEARRGDPRQAVAAWTAALTAAGDQQATAGQILAGLDLWRWSEDWTTDDAGKWVPYAGAFIAKRKYLEQPRGFAFLRDRTPCQTRGPSCRGQADDCARDSAGQWWCFCRACQPHIPGMRGTEIPRLAVARAM